MIVFCEKCQSTYDDVYRWTICPHDTFMANDGQNNFAHHPESYLDVSRQHPIRNWYPVRCVIAFWHRYMLDEPQWNFPPDPV